MHRISLLLLVGAISTANGLAAEPVSYYNDVRPIFQAHCTGCHQPAKKGGAYSMTSYAQVVAAGESGEIAVVPNEPDASYLLEQITPDAEGHAEMPKGRKPLSTAEIALIERWIAAGAIDDTPENAGRKYDPEHPPVYSHPPVITSLDFSPDGQLLAIAGFHEVLLRSGDGKNLVARLIGMSERIESVKFSPDGKRLAVAAGNPARSGELQIWNAETHELELSLPLTADTTYGVSWSPDGKLVAIGCSDNVVRGFDSHTGAQVFFNGAHDDWPLQTVFSKEGTHLVSVGRDMSTKLYEVDTQRFVDNVTSITPGALKGGLSALARNPGLDQLAVGGSDGSPRIYRMERVTKRVIGDDANLLRRYAPMKGRIYGVAFSPDGKLIACVSSHNGKGQLNTYKAEIDGKLPDDIKKIVEMTVQSQNQDQKNALEAFITADNQAVTQLSVDTSLYAVAFHPDGTKIVTGGWDGLIRVINAADGQVVEEFLPIDVSNNAELTANSAFEKVIPDDALAAPDGTPEGITLSSLELTPPAIQLAGEFDYAQILVTGVLTSGERIDLTRLAKVTAGSDVVQLSALGRVRASRNGETQLTVTYGDHQAQCQVSVTGCESSAPISFIRDVNPVLSRLGCNQGTCHGAKDGKNGFKLSLRGYDPLYDVRAFTDDVKARRTNVASPDDSLMLLKATGVVPHVGGQLTRPGEPYYEIIRRWIAEGCVLDHSVERVASITIQPTNPVVQQIGARQQLRIVATYTNGRVRDVTGEAHLESGNTEAAEVNSSAVVTAIRRGEAPILARFEGNYAATTLTVMGDRSGFVWKAPETWNQIDELVAAKWERMKLLPSGLCSDEEFIRRAYLDITGLPPSMEAVLAFVQDGRETRTKRDALIDELVGSPAYIDYWTNKWCDLLQVNRKFLGAEGAKMFRSWVREHVANNTPYDQFARAILTAEGSNKENPAASYYKILREPDAMMENTTHLFLAVRFNCNKCHDHPFERWTQDQYYQTTAFFSRVGLKRDPQNADGNIGGTAVEGAKPLWEVVFEKDSGETVHDRTGEETAPVVPYDRDISLNAEASRRTQLADWITSSDNDYFARSYVNRVWGYIMGVGLIEPLDDIRAGNPPSNPELLDFLTHEFIASGFDVQNLIKMICKSRVYQLNVATHEWNAGDTLNYSHALPKRLPAEVLYDAVYTVTGAKMQIPGVPEGTRAAAIPDVGIELTDGFLANLGRPVRESACECERSGDLQLGPVMALMNGPTVSNAISQEKNAIQELVSSEQNDEALINKIFLRILNRSAHPSEVAAAQDIMHSLQQEHQSLFAQLEQYQAQIAPVLAEKEAARQAAIAEARANLEKYQSELQPKLDAAEQARQEKIAAAEKAAAEYLTGAVARVAEWEKTAIERQSGWTALELTNLKATNGAKLEAEKDLAVFVSGPNNRKGAYVVVGRTKLQGITGIKLELLTDDRLPSRGPGRAQNGNFVLSEFTVEAWPAGKPEEKKTLKLKNAKADFSQDNYAVETAIDGKAPNSGNGWATSPKTGENRVATFELEEPIQFEPGTLLSFKLDQQYQDNMHTIGRFRISLTTSPTPVDFGHPEQIVQILSADAAARTEEQQQALVDYYNQSDAEYQQKLKAVAEAKKPLPEDAKLVELRKELADREQPLPVDPQLARLERAVTLSDQQQKNARLTMAQDLTWALINSPAFLFNR